MPRRTPAQVESDFRAILAGAEIELLSRFVDARTLVKVRCSKGDYGWLRPDTVLNKNAPLCRPCAALSAKKEPNRGKRTAAQWQAEFLAVMDGKNAKVIGPIGRIKDPVECVCPQNHPWRAIPACVLYQDAGCPECWAHTSEIGEAKLRAIVAARNASIGSDYINSQTKILILCGKHEWWAIPNNVLRGSWCFECVGNSPNRAGAEWVAMLAEQGGRLDEDSPDGKYVNGNTLVAVVCEAEHRTRIRPSSRYRYGARGCCLKCSPRDPDAARDRTYAVLEKRGDTRLSDYAGAFVLMTISCAAGDIYEMTPHDIQNDRGCPTCRGKQKEVFYVLTTPDADVIKFGVACRDGKQRLASHRKDKLTIELLWLAGLTGRAALELENAVKNALMLGGFEPIRGREYFRPEALQTVLDVVDATAAARSQ